MKRKIYLGSFMIALSVSKVNRFPQETNETYDS
jgi:hypothetical protein